MSEVSRIQLYQDNTTSCKSKGWVHRIRTCAICEASWIRMGHVFGLQSALK